MKPLIIVSGILLACPAWPCTIMVVARGGNVFAAANEDDDNRPDRSSHYIRFVPGNKETATLGYVAFGYKNNPFSDESAMNEAGLFYDFDALEKLDKPREGRPNGKFNAINEMLTKCRTVKQAVEFIEAIDLPFMSSAQLVLGDASGASAIVERHATTWRQPKVDFQIGTNFRTSTTPLEAITCERFKQCSLELNKRSRVSAGSLTEILRRTSADGSGIAKTWYSMVCDLKRRRVTLYYQGDFAKGATFDLLAELKVGPKKLDLSIFISDLLAKPGR